MALLGRPNKLDDGISTKVFFCSFLRIRNKQNKMEIKARARARALLSVYGDKFYEDGLDGRRKRSRRVIVLCGFFFFPTRFIVLSLSREILSLSPLLPPGLNGCGFNNVPSMSVCLAGFLPAANATVSQVLTVKVCGRIVVGDTAGHPKRKTTHSPADGSARLVSCLVQRLADVRMTTSPTQLIFLYLPPPRAACRVVGIP